MLYSVTVINVILNGESGLQKVFRKNEDCPCQVRKLMNSTVTDIVS
jgi:hypothetical protein